MADMELLSLELRSPLDYRGFENPAIAGAPIRGATLLPTASGSMRELGLGEDLSDGEEEVFFFDEEELVAFDANEGPVLRRPLPAPRFYGRRAAAPPDSAAQSASPAASAARLPTGAYAFVQWRPADEAGLIEGLEWFARETWWERTGAKGPYILRRLREDGKLATQAWRRIGE